MSKKVFLFLLLINSAFLSMGLTDDPQITFILYQVSQARFSPNGDGINDIAYFSLHAIVATNKVHGNAPIKWEIEVRKSQNNAEVWEEDGTVAMNPNGYTEFTIIVPWDGCKKDGNLLGSEHKPSAESNCQIAPDGNYTHKATIHYKGAKESQSGTLAIDNTDPDLLIISPANSTITNNQNIEIIGKSSANITQIIIGNQTIYPSAGNWSTQISLSEGQNNLTVQGKTADGKSITKELNIIKKAYFSAYIADFENGMPAIEPYHGLAGDRDTAPDISLSTATYNRGSASVKLAATTWKTYHFTNQNIRPVALNATSELFFAIRVDTLAQMIGIGIGDGNKELIYAISGTKIMAESFINKNYQNSITNDSQWHFLKLPAGVDWNALWGSYGQIDRIFIIHDNTNIPISHTAYFDDIGILDNIVPP